MKTFVHKNIPQFILFTKIYNQYDYDDYYFDEQTDTFVSKFIGKDSDAEKLTVLYKAFNRNYMIQDSLYETILNLNKMKVDPSATVSGEQLNAFLEKMSKYLKDIQMNIK